MTVAHALAILDTSVVISMPPNLDRFTVEVGISAVTIGELAFGIANFFRATRPSRTTRRRPAGSAHLLPPCAVTEGIRVHAWLT